MPGNSNPPPLTASKSSLVRSKSLRLTTSRPKLEQSGTSTLTRHGSIRGPRTPNPALSSSKPSLAVFKKPALKPKPSFSSSKSNDQIENSSKINSNSIEGDSRKINANSPIKLSDGKGIPASDSHPTPSESPTSFHSDKSHSQDANSWCNSDLISHLKRLTEEHEKLQVEYARQRLQLLENVSVQSVSNLRRDQQHLSQSDSHLASIPENFADSENGQQSQTETLEAIVQSLKNEVIHLQEDNRKSQRKYWEQVLNSELVIDEPCNDASQQIVDLIDKLDGREKELLEATGKVQELENHLATSNLELQQCQDALSDQQRMLEEANMQREEYGKHVRELRSALLEAKDQIDFLQIERSTLAEAYQETEQSLSATKAELMKEQSRSFELMDKARKLYAKVKDYNLQVQLLKAELDRTQGNCRDMLLSQGAELTMISMHLSQISMNVHTMLTAAADFAASELSLQKEMLEEIMADLDSESEHSISPSEQNGILKFDSQISSLEASHNNIKSDDKVLDIHKSLPDISSSEPVKPLHSPAASESERPVSLVQSMVRAYEKTAKNDSKLLKQNLSKSFSEQNSDSAKSSIENLSSINGDFSHISSISKDSSPVASSAFKPIGTATAFRPVRQRSLESEVSPVENANFEEEKKASVEAQLNQMNNLLKKVGKVIELTQEKFSSRIKSLIEEKNSIQDELRSCKNKQYQMQADLNNKDILIERSNEKIKQLSSEVKKNEAEYTEEKENLISKNETLTEEIKCLEAVNAELSQQLTLKLEKSLSESNHGFRTNAEDICDKLTLKQEIAKLKAIIEQKEKLLQQLSQKFSRTKVTHEQNLKQAEKEIEILDNVILKVYTTLQTNSELVEKNEVLQNLQSLVSGNCTLPNMCPTEDKK